MDINLKELILLIYFFILSSAYPQDSTIVTIETRGIGAVIADRIIFEIDLNIEDDDYQLAFNKHKEQMKDLIQILNQLNTPDSVIHFSLFKINKTVRRTERSEVFRTHQKVSVIITGFQAYDNLQIALISSDFYSFSTEFFSSKAEFGRNEAIQNAILSGQRQMHQIADEINKKKYEIVHIDVREQYRPLPGEIIEFFADDTRSNIEKIPQHVNYVVVLKITYKLSD